jgi:hypothetical protein
VTDESFSPVLLFPHAGWSIAVGVAALLAELGALLVARREWERSLQTQRAAVRGNWGPAAQLRRPSLALPAIALLAPLAPLALAVGLVHAARLGILEAALADAPDKGAIYARAIVEELGALSCGLLGAFASGLVGCLTVGLSISGHVRTTGLRRALLLHERHPVAGYAWARFPGPRPSVILGCVAAFVILGGVPAARGLFAALRAKVRALEGMAGLAIEARPAFLDQALGEAAEALDRDFIVCCAGLSVAALVTAVVGWVFSSERARSRNIGRAEARPISRAPGAFGVPLLMFATAAWVFFVTAPIKSENAAPWPPPASSTPGLRLPPDLVTPALDGPDRVERGPVLAVAATRLTLDGEAVGDPGQLGARLRALRASFARLQPRADWAGSLLVLCTPETPAGRVFEALSAAGDAGFRHPTFAFLRRETALRPLLGSFRRTHTTGARTELIARPGEADPATTTVVRPRGAESCGELSARIVTARGGGRQVAILPGDAGLSVK